MDWICSFKLSFYQTTENFLTLIGDINRLTCARYEIMYNINWKITYQALHGTQSWCLSVCWSLLVYQYKPFGYLLTMIYESINGLSCWVKRESYC